MCFQIPKKITSITDSGAIVEGNITVKLGSLKAAPGDYLLVYGNIAVEKIEEKNAMKMRNTINEFSKNKARQQT